MEYKEITKENKQNIDFQCVPFCIEKSQSSGRDSMHVHDFHQLTIVMHGTATLNLNGVNYPVRQGDIYIISSFSAHFLKEQQEFQFVNILFYMKDLAGVAQDLQESEAFKCIFYLQPVLQQFSRPANMLSLTYEEVEVIKRYLDLLVDEVSNEKMGQQTVIQSCFMLLITTICRAYKPQQQRHIPSFAYQLRELIHYIEEKCGDKLSILTMCTQSGLGERQLRNIFAKTYQCTPMQYLQNVRIHKACYYLSSTDMTVAEVGEVIGFEDNNYFSRIFRKTVGISPSKYRNEQQYSISNECTSHIDLPNWRVNTK